MARLAENTKLAAVVLVVAALSASAATRTWNGGGDGSTWADARNWGGTAPAAGDDVVVSATSVNDLGSADSPLALHSLTLSGAITVSGNPVRIANAGRLRLAQVRDGVEDYELLQLLAAKKGADAADGESRALIRSLTDFSRSPPELRDARSRIFGKLLR